MEAPGRIWFGYIAAVVIAVMGLLTSAAREAGAVHGLLVASELGEHLDAGLGWRVEARLVTARSATPRTSVESRHV